MTGPDAGDAYGPDGVIDGRAWAALVDRLGHAGALVWGDPTLSDTDRAEGLRYLLRFLASGLEVCTALDDTDHPELGTMVEDRRSWGLDNPDCLYRYCRLDGRARYELDLTVGTARHLELQVNTGHFGDGDFAGWQALGALGRDDLVLDASGQATVTIGGEATGVPNHLPMDERAGFLLVRQYLCDWEHEVPATMAIERVGAPYPAAVLTPGAIGAQAALLDQWLDAGLACWDMLSRGLMDGAGDEIAPFVPPASAGGLKGLAYGFGGWSCSPDEAVVVDVTPPDCRMWGVSLCDRWWQSVDFATHQSSLNSCQASLDADGRFVAVVTHDDPGLANWLDPAGATAGTLTVRYLFADDLPVARLRVVPRHALDEALAGMGHEPVRVTPSERADVLRRRRAAVVRRYGR